MLIRKTRSFIKKSLYKINSYIARLKIMILEENIKIGKNVSLGKKLKVKTFDNGKILIEDNVSIEDDIEIIAQVGNIIISKNTFIGKGTQIVSKKSIVIGEDCLIASYNVIRDNNHKIEKNKLINQQGHTIKEIKIENDVWIGTHCTITAGVHIHEGAVIGANSVVTKDIEEYSVVGGVPAKFIKRRI